MKKIIIASLLMVSVFAVDSMAKKSGSSTSSKEVSSEKKGGRGGKGHAKPTFDTNGCLTTTETKGPMADALSKGDADSDGCVTETELKTFMENNRPSGNRPSGNPPKRPDED